MTLVIRSLDGGEIETGFWGPDTSQVQLGELPLITVQQFVGYAALTLAEGIIPQLDPVTRRDWAEEAHALREGVEAVPTIKSTGNFIGQDIDSLTSQLDAASPEDREELLAMIAAVGVPTEGAVYYSGNPFKVQSDGQRVGFAVDDEVRHVISSEDFYNLTYRVIHGGIMGWGSRGTYPEVKEAAVQLDTVLSS